MTANELRSLAAMLLEDMMDAKDKEKEELDDD